MRFCDPEMCYGGSRGTLEHILRVKKILKIEPFFVFIVDNIYLVFLLLLLFTEAPCDIFKIFTYLDHIILY